MADASYSPRLRTGIVFCGAGSSGVYHAGVLRALTESGVKIDVVAGHGAGVMTALCGAIDGGAKLWDPNGPWISGRLTGAYRWRLALRLAGLGLLAAFAILLMPLLVMVLAAAMYAVSLVAGLINQPGAAAWLVGVYQQMIEVLFNPPFIPTVVPRAIILALLCVAGVLAVAAARAAAEQRSRRRFRGAFWWRLLGAPLESVEPGASLIETLWTLVRGASNEPRPAVAEIGRRYADTLIDNLGQPGFREVIVAVHDLDARRDLVGAVLTPLSRQAFEGRRKGGGPREAEVVDLGGTSRVLVVDFLAGALRLPVASPPHLVRFPADSYWRGEEHRLCDRPELAARLIDEMAGIGVEQVVIVGASPPAASPHGMRTHPIDLRGRVGEFARSIETAVFNDAATAAAPRFSGVFVVRPDHNPIGPFDFAGSFDEASDRWRSSAELLQQGYDDAYRQFIEPVVAAGERLDQLEMRELPSVRIS